MDENKSAESSPQQLPVANNKVANDLNLPVSIAAQVMISGILRGAGNTPAELVMRAIAYHVGFGMSSQLVGNLSALINVRKAMQDAFQEGVKKAPLNANPTDMPPPFNPSNLKRDGSH